MSFESNARAGFFSVAIPSLLLRLHLIYYRIEYCSKARSLTGTVPFQM